jgi:hypothetical protein
VRWLLWVLTVCLAFSAGSLFGTLMTYARVKLYGWQTATDAEMRAIPAEAWRMFKRLWVTSHTAKGTAKNPTGATNDA